MTKRKLTKYEDDIRRNLRKSAEINPAQSPHDGIHTCSKGCKKPGCNRGLRETIEEQNAQIEALKQDLKEQAASVRNSRMANIHDLNEIGGLQEENARLKAEVERLTIQGGDSEPRFVLLSEYRHLKGLLAFATTKYCRLEAEVERLRKAGDAMATNIPRMVTCQVTAHEAVDLIKAWQAAKEGKPSA